MKIVWIIVSVIVVVVGSTLAFMNHAYKTGHTLGALRRLICDTIRKLSIPRRGGSVAALVGQ